MTFVTSQYHSLSTLTSQRHLLVLLARLYLQRKSVDGDGIHNDVRQESTLQGGSNLGMTHRQNYLSERQVEAGRAA